MASRFTDDELNAFIDGELDADTRRQLQDRLTEDSEFAAKVQDYRAVDQALRDAFTEIMPPAAAQSRVVVQSPRASLAVVAVLLLPLLFLAGWLSHSALTPSGSPGLSNGGVGLAAASHAQRNTVFHIDVDDHRKVEDLFARVEEVLAAHAAEGVAVEVVTNAAGVNVLRSDTTEFAEQLRALTARYDNLTFVACANTIKRLEKQGIKVDLVDQVHTGEAALDHIISRLRDGWTYIKI